MRLETVMVHTTPSLAFYIATSGFLFLKYKYTSFKIYRTFLSNPAIYVYHKLGCHIVKHETFARKKPSRFHDSYV